MSRIVSLTDYDGGLGRERDALKGFAELLAAAAHNDDDTFGLEELPFVACTVVVLVDALDRKIKECDAQMRAQLGQKKMATA